MLESERMLKSMDLDVIIPNVGMALARERVRVKWGPVATVRNS